MASSNVLKFLKALQGEVSTLLGATGQQELLDAKSGGSFSNKSLNHGFCTNADKGIETHSGSKVAKGLAHDAEAARGWERDLKTMGNVNANCFHKNCLSKPAGRNQKAVSRSFQQV